MERKWGPGSVVGGSALYELENQGVCRVPVVADLEHEANSGAVADCAEVKVLVPQHGANHLGLLGGAKQAV